MEEVGNIKEQDVLFVEDEREGQCFREEEKEESHETHRDSEKTEFQKKEAIKDQDIVSVEDPKGNQCFLEEKKVEKNIEEVGNIKEQDVLFAEDEREGQCFREEETEESHETHPDSKKTKFQKKETIKDKDIVSVEDPKGDQCFLEEEKVEKNIEEVGNIKEQDVLSVVEDEREGQCFREEEKDVIDIKEVEHKLNVDTQGDEINGTTVVWEDIKDIKEGCVELNSVGEERIEERPMHEKNEAKQPHEKLGEGLETTGIDDHIENQIKHAQVVVEDHYIVTNGKETLEENSQKSELLEHKAKVLEGIDTAKVTRKQIIEDVIIASPVIASIEVVKESSQEEEVRKRLDTMSEGGIVVEQVSQDVIAAQLYTTSVGEIKESSQEDELNEEINTPGAREKAQNRAMKDAAGTDIYMVSESAQRTVGSSQEDEKKKIKQEQVTECNLGSEEGAKDSTKEIQIVILKDEEDTNKSSNICSSTEAPRKGLTLKETNEKLPYTSMPTVSEEQIKEIPDNKESESNNHETTSVRILTEKMSLYVTESKCRNQVDASDIASKEMIPSPSKENLSSNICSFHVEDEKFDETFNLNENTSKEILLAEGSGANQGKREMDEIPEGASVAIRESVDQDTATTTAADITASTSSSPEKLEEKPEELTMLISNNENFNSTKENEKIENEIPLKDELRSENLGSPLATQMKEKMSMQVEEHMELEDEPELGPQDNEQESFLPELEPDSLCSESKDAITERETIIDLRDVSDNCKSETPEQALQEKLSQGKDQLDAISNELEEVEEYSTMERDILKGADPIKEAHQTISRSRMESMIAEDIFVQTEAKYHSHENEFSNITSNQNVTQILETIDLGEKLESISTMSDQKVEKEIETIKQHDAATLQKQIGDPCFQEDEMEGRNLEEGTKLDANYENAETNDSKMLIENTIAIQEIPSGVKEDYETETIGGEITKEVTAANVEVTPGNGLVKEVKDSHLSNEQKVEANNCEENTGTENWAYFERLIKKANAYPDTEASGEETLNKDSEKLKEVSSAASEVSEEYMKEEILGEVEDTVDMLHSVPVIAAKNETCALEIKPKGETIAETLGIGFEEKQESITDEKLDGEEVKQGGPRAETTRSNLEIDEQNDKAENDEEINLIQKVEAAELENGEKYMDNLLNLGIAHLSGEILVKEVGGGCEEPSNLEAYKLETDFKSTSETQIHEIGIVTKKSEYYECGGDGKGHDYLSISDGNVGKSFPKDEEGEENLVESEHKLDAVETQDEKTNEVHETRVNKDTTKEVATPQQNYSGTENTQFSRDEEVIKDSFLLASIAQPTQDIHGEDEKEGDNAKEESNNPPEEQIHELETEEAQRMKRCDENETPDNQILNQEVCKSSENDVARLNIDEHIKEEKEFSKDNSAKLVTEDTVNTPNKDHETEELTNPIEESNREEEYEGHNTKEELNRQEPEEQIHELEAEEAQRVEVRDEKEAPENQFPNPDIKVVEERKNIDASMNIEKEITAEDGLVKKQNLVVVKESQQGDETEVELEVAGTKLEPEIRSQESEGGNDDSGKTNETITNVHEEDYKNLENAATSQDIQEQIKEEKEFLRYIDQKFAGKEPINLPYGKNEIDGIAKPIEETHGEDEKEEDNIKDKSHSCEPEEKIHELEDEEAQRVKMCDQKEAPQYHISNQKVSKSLEIAATSQNIEEQIKEKDSLPDIDLKLVAEEIINTPCEADKSNRITEPIQETHGEDEEEGDNIKEKSNSREPGEQIYKWETEEAQEVEKFDEKKVPQNQSSNQEVVVEFISIDTGKNTEEDITGEEGQPKDPHLVTSKEEVQKSQPEKVKVKVAATKLEPEITKGESFHTGKTNEITENVNEEVSKSLEDGTTSQNIEEQIKEKKESLKVIDLKLVSKETINTPHREHEVEGEIFKGEAPNLDTTCQDHEFSCKHHITENEEVTSSEEVFVETFIEVADPTAKQDTMTTVDGEEKSQINAPPAKHAPAHETPSEVVKTHEEKSDLGPEEFTYEKINENTKEKGNEIEVGSAPEGLLQVEKPSESPSSPITKIEELNRELVSDGNDDVSPHKEPSRKDMHGEEDKITEDEIQEFVFVKQPTPEVRLPPEVKSFQQGLVEPSIETADPTVEEETMISKNQEGKNQIDAPPGRHAPAHEAPSEAIEYLEEESDVPGESIHVSNSEDGKDKKHATDVASAPEGLHEVEKPYESTSSPISKIEELDRKLVYNDNNDASSLIEISQKDMHGKEGKTTEVEEIQEFISVKQATTEVRLPPEAPVNEIFDGGLKKVNKIDSQEKICAYEDETKNLKENRSRENEMLEETSNLTAAKQYHGESSSFKNKETEISVRSTDIPSTSVSLIGEPLQRDEVGDPKQREAFIVEPKVKQVESGGEERMPSLDQEISELKPSESDKFTLSNLLQCSRKDTADTVRDSIDEKNLPAHKEEMESKEAPITRVEEDKDGKDGEEEDGHKKEESSSDALVIVEASKDIEVKPAHKKSHNILSGVGSKVKHSISKVKKAITGKSSHHK